MNKSIWILPLFLFAVINLSAQYYLRGEVRDEHGNTLDGVKIKLFSRPLQPYFSGNAGAFGIPSPVIFDTVYLEIDGFEKLSLPVDTRKFQRIQLKMLPGTAKLYKKNRASITPHLPNQANAIFSVPGESYSGLIENGFINTNQFPETGFSLNIDNASYSNIRRFLSNEMFIPQDAIRIEEMLNYFSLPIKEKTTSDHSNFTHTYRLTDCPWNKENQLLFLHLSAPALVLDEVPPSNLVFLIDISGSMDKPNRLPLLQSAFKLLVNNLRDKDTIAILTYGGGVGIALPATSGSHQQKIKDVIDSLAAGGDTPGAGAIQMAYEQAKKTFIPEGNNRVILATDGDFNVGQASEKELEDLIVKYKQTGIYLTCLGVGMGNYKDSKLEALSKKGNGNFAYIDHIREAEKVLVTEFTKTLYAVASNASITVQFNSNYIKSYRLIGFDNKKNAIEDSSSVLEGGEIGSGHNSLAIFEITPASADSILENQPLADILLQYNDPKNSSLKKQKFIALNKKESLELVDSTYRFMAAVAMFGSVLRKSKFTNDYQLEDVLNLATKSIDKNNILQREFVSLIEKAIKVYQPSKKKRKDGD